VRIYLLILSISLFFFGANFAFAAAPTISNVPSSINTDNEFSISTALSGLSNNTVYRLRLALATAGTNNYFGSTFNGSSYYNGTPSPINYANFLSITTDGAGSWSGTVRGKVETSDPNFSGISGIYDLKVGRYTETGTSATWSNILQIAVNAPSPTPSASPTPSPSPSLSPTPTATPQASSSFTISNAPSQINSDQSFSVNINLSIPNSQNTDYYLKGAFKKSDGTRYLGLTKNGSDWIEYGDDYNDQYKITTDASGTWSGNLEVKPDKNDNDFKGTGNYIFKVGRYTQGGSGPAWSNEITVKINNLDNPSRGNSPTPQATKEVSPSPSVFKSPSPRPTPSLKPTPKIASVAGAKASSSASDIKGTKVEVKSQKQSNPLIGLGVLFIIAGAGLIGYIYFYKNAKVHI